MFFLAPFALIGLLLIALPLLIHLLVRRRAARLDFPTLRFLRETQSFRLRPRRVQEPLLLFLRVLALAFLVLTFARPFVSFSKRSERARLILIDASLSMRARGRADAAQAQARTLVNRMATGERAAILAFSSSSSVLAPFTSDRQQLIQSIEQYQTTSDAANYNAAFAKADALLQSEPASAAEIDLISDFQQSGPDRQDETTSHRAPQNAAAQVLTFPVGKEIERNAFLMDEDVRTMEKVTELSATEIISATDGRSGQRRSWAIDGAEGARGDIEWRTESNGQIAGQVRTLAPDDFDEDDARYFSFTPREGGRALLIETDSDASFYLRAALEAATSGETSQKKLERLNQLPSDQSALNSYSLITLTLRNAPEVETARRLIEYTRAGGTVLICLVHDADTASLNAFAQTEAAREFPFQSVLRKSGDQSFSFGTMDADAPALRSLDKAAFDSLRAARIVSGFEIERRAGANTILRWTDGAAALVSAKIGRGSLLVFGTAPERAAGDLSANTSFPLLISSIRREADAPRAALSHTLGKPLFLDEVSPDAFVKVTDARGQIKTATARELAQSSSKIFREPGIYRVERGSATEFIAFNAPLAESERSLASPEEIKRRFPENKDAKVFGGNGWRERLEQRGGLWRYLIVASFLFMLAELFVSIRRKGLDEA
ncbi:MAG: VWA domain-containing protein [Pyrinomonadaceae bacterium]